MRKGRESVDPPPFLLLTGYAFGVSRRLTWVTVSEEELGRRTIDFLVAQLRITNRRVEEPVSISRERPKDRTLRWLV
jgi:hypothetical protein